MLPHDHVGVWHATGVSMFSVFEKATGGGRTARAVRPDGWPGAEVGWGIVCDCPGRGCTTEGAEAAMDFGFDRHEWTDIIHSLEPDNIASQQVARSTGASRNGGDRLARDCATRVRLVTSIRSSFL